MRCIFLPQSTPYDPAEDPPGSVDPLGTVTGAEQLAEILFPGVTARMWRVRLLTFAALASEVARRVTGNREENRLDARLAFERLFVSAICRQEVRNDSWQNAARRLPGIGLARTALRSGDQPLARANFLKGQAVNGPFGVISRLARNVNVVDESGELSSAGTELLLAWSEDQGLHGLLDDDPGREGANWIRRIAKQVSAVVDDSGNWPNKYWPGWSDLATRLRLDEPGKKEASVITKLVLHDPLGLRERTVKQLVRPDVQLIYQKSVQNNDRGGVEKTVFISGVYSDNGDDEVGITLRRTIDLIDAYESLAGIMESVFRGLIWGLTQNGGHSPQGQVIQNPVLQPFFLKAHANLTSMTPRFRKCLDHFESDALALKRDSVDVDRMSQLLEDAISASHSIETCVTSVMERHVKVQREKRKGVWIEQEQKWALMPGFGDSSDEPKRFEGYLHPYRVTNMYSMLADLSLVTETELADGEEE